MKLKLLLDFNDDAELLLSEPVTDEFKFADNLEGTDNKMTPAIPLIDGEIAGAIALGIISAGSYDALKALLKYLISKTPILRTENIQLVTKGIEEPIVINETLSDEDISELTERIIHTT